MGMKVITSIFTDDYKWYDDSIETFATKFYKDTNFFKYLHIQEGALMRET